MIDKLKSAWTGPLINCTIGGNEALKKIKTINLVDHKKIVSAIVLGGGGSFLYFIHSNFL